MTDSADPLFGADVLGRKDFAQRLAAVIGTLAQADAVAGGRVVAVDAAWGSGKTWVATKLPQHLAESQAGRCIYLNAFEFDYHGDAFSVLASAILKECSDLGTKTTEFKKGALNVLKVAAPPITKEVVKAAAKWAGVDSDDLVEKVAEATGKASDRALDKMLKSFEETIKSTTAFKQRLSELAEAAGGCLTIVIDELDRCRPDFSLALLERMKHLFEVRGVVFVLFLESKGLQSAIRHTYGAVNPDAYLRKFISVWLQLPNSNSSKISIADQSSFVGTFLSHTYPTFITTQEDQEFIWALAAFAPFFNATLRDVQNVVLLGSILRKSLRQFGMAAAYLLLMKVCDPSAFDEVSANPNSAFAHEAMRLDLTGSDQSEVAGQVLRLHDMFWLRSRPDEFQASKAALLNIRHVWNDHDLVALAKMFERLHGKLRIEHLSVS